MTILALCIPWVFAVAHRLAHDADTPVE